MVEEKKKESKERYELAEVPTQTAMMIHDNDTDETQNELTLLVKIANDIEKIKRSLVG